jgi:AraC-like DNA-binding protein
LGRVLASRRLVEHEGITVDEVVCRHGRGPGQTVETATRYALVFVRRGCFQRRADGGVALLDPTVAFCTNPGEDQWYDHPHEQGDDCTSLGLDPSLVASIWRGRTELPAAVLPTLPSIDVSHRLLLAEARRGADPEELAERSITLAASALELLDPRPVRAGRPTTARARRALADRARQSLVADTRISLPRLAGELGVSAHHLSRVFRSHTGHTLARHRMRLRARHALERLAGGDRDLAQLAADLGFADQSHLCRVIRAETGHTPVQLRRLL